MKKTLLIGTIATVLALGAVGGSVVVAHGAFAQSGWDGPNYGMGGPGRGGPGMMTGMRDHSGMGFGAGPGMGPGMGMLGHMGQGMPLFDELDRSGDGELDQAEIDAARGERLAAFDADSDGVLSLDEYEALWLDAMRRRMVRDFQRLDVDGDARVTEEEFLSPYSRIVEQFDNDGDGVIIEDEVRQTMRERRSEMRGRSQMRGPSEMGGRTEMQRGDGPRRSGPDGEGRGPRGQID